MLQQGNEEKGRREAAPQSRPLMAEVFGFQVPTSNYFLHRRHAWAVMEASGKVRVGMDDFSQKVLGPADALKLPEIGKVYYQDHVCMALLRQGHKASVVAPVDGAIEAVNPKVLQNPGLIYDDPYGEGWMFLVNPTNLKQNMENLLSGEANLAWIDQESHRLLSLMDTTAGATLPSGGTVVGDVYGNYPKLGWRRLVGEFLLTDLTKTWKKRS
jgi:glycine cleavage system H lipoate-binding protein